MTNTIAIAIAALVFVESGGKKNAVGDGGRAVGILQAWPVAVREANRITKNRKHYTLADRRDTKRAIEMCTDTLRWHYRRGVTDPVDLACRWRNPKGDAPQWYRDRVEKAIATIDRKGEAR